MKTYKWIFVSFLLLSLQFTQCFGEIVLPDLDQPYPAADYRKNLWQVYRQYQAHPEQEEKYLSVLSLMNQYLLQQPRMKKVVAAYQAMKLEDSESSYDHFDQLGDDFSRIFGLDGRFIPNVSGSFFDLPENDYFDLHNHLNNNAVILVVAGELESKNFEISSETNASKLQILKTKNVLLRAGEVSTFGAIRDNLHEIYAGSEGALFFVVYTNTPDTASSHTHNGDLYRSDEPISKDFPEYYEAGWGD